MRAYALAAFAAAFSASPIVFAGDLSRLDPDSLMPNVTFVDAVLCDTFEQVDHIANSEHPSQAIEYYFELENAEGLPTCSPGSFTGDILDARQLNPIITSARRVSAWAVEVRVNGFVGWTLVAFELNELLV